MTVLEELYFPTEKQMAKKEKDPQATEIRNPILPCGNSVCCQLRQASCDVNTCAKYPYFFLVSLF